MQSGELLEVLGGLEHPPRAAAQPLQSLEDATQVGVARSLVAGQVVVAPGRHGGDGLEEHGREVDGQELDLLVGVVDGHLVHAFEIGHRRVDEPQRLLGPLPAGSGPPDAGCSRSGSTGSRLSQYGRDRRCRVGGHQVVQMRGPGAGQPADDDGRDTLDVEDLWMADDEVLDEQPVAQQAGQEGVLATHAGGVRSASFRRAEHRTSSRSTKSRSPKSSSPVCSDAAAMSGSVAKSRPSAASAIMAMSRRRPTSERNRGRARSSMTTGAGRSVTAGRRPAVPTVTTSVLGRRGCARAGTSGTRSAPCGCPAVETQLRMSGVGVGHDDLPRAVRLVVDLGPVDGDPLVVVVVGVEEGVPEAHVPERALGRAPAEDEGLVVGRGRRCPWRRRRRRPPTRRSSWGTG